MRCYEDSCNRFQSFESFECIFGPCGPLAFPFFDRCRMGGDPSFLSLCSAVGDTLATQSGAAHRAVGATNGRMASVAEPDCERAAVAGICGGPWAVLVLAST